jgi:hypothetical protein
MTSRTITFVGFGVIFALMIAWAAVAALVPNWMALPDAFRTLTRRRAIRMVVVVGWIWLGWHLFARGSGAFN